LKNCLPADEEEFISARKKNENMFAYKLQQPIEAHKAEYHANGKRKGRGACSQDQQNCGGGGLERAIHADLVAFRDIYVTQLEKEAKHHHHHHHGNNIDGAGVSFAKFKQIVWKDGNFQLVFQ